MLTWYVCIQEATFVSLKFITQDEFHADGVQEEPSRKIGDLQAILGSWEELPVTLDRQEQLDSITSRQALMSTPSVALVDKEEEGEQSEDVVFNLFYPIGQAGDRAGALLASQHTWGHFLSNILDEGNLQVVVDPTCSTQGYTYNIDASRAQLQSVDDLHDRYHDALMVQQNLADIVFNATEEYKGVPVNWTYCPTSIRIYPTNALREQYRDDKPALAACMVAIIFVVTCALFKVYDICVERRQRTLLMQNLTSSSNQSALEENVRERTKLLEETNERLAQANAKITKASQAQLKHFASLSHEIRTPLNCIIGSSSLLKGTQLSASQKESVQMITSSGDLLLSVVNDVLDYSRLETGDVEIQLSMTSLQEVLDSVVWTIAARAETQGMKLATDFAMNVPEHLVTDIRRLQQILYNLLGNALKFNSEGGEVQLNLSVTSTMSIPDTYSPPSEIELDLNGGGHGLYLRIEVSDEGKGIDKKNFAKIFKPFQQENNETGKLYGGSGLGLAISTKLLHRMGGTIAVKSNVGQGSDFVIHLPIPLYERFDKRLSLAPYLKEIRAYMIVLASKDESDQNYMQSASEYYEFDLQHAESHEETEVIFQTDSDRPYLLLVGRELSRTSISLPNKKSLSVSFGSNASDSTTPEDSSTKAHFRSLQQLLPVVLIKGLANVVNSDMDRTIRGSYMRRVSSSMSENDLKIPYSTLRILVAEDNLVNQKVLQRMLLKLGIQQVDVVSDGQQAVDQEAKEEYDFVFMDMQMPVMDGIDACKAIQQRASSDGTIPKIVFVTAHALKDFEEECFQAGGFDFISKPCKIENIEACFKRMYKKMTGTTSQSSLFG